MSTVAPTTPQGRSDTALVRLRPLARGETDTLLEIFDGLSPRSRQRRFLAPVPRLTPHMLRALSTVDGYDRVALVAETVAGGRPIGIARFARDAQDRTTAEIAFSVVDAWQGRGVGSQLTEALTACALRLGIRRFTLAMLPDNQVARRLAQRIPGDLQLVAADRYSVEYTLVLDAASVQRGTPCTSVAPTPDLGTEHRCGRVPDTAKVDA